jgi:hypothetical protein
VEEIPNFLKPVRSSAAYSMPPGYPPRGGTFFIDRYTGSSVVPKDYLKRAMEILKEYGADDWVEKYEMAIASFQTKFSNCPKRRTFCALNHKNL